MNDGILYNALKGIAAQAKEQVGDVFEGSWNSKSHQQITVTIAELRAIVSAVDDANTFEFAPIDNTKPDRVILGASRDGRACQIEVKDDSDGLMITQGEDALAVLPGYVGPLIQAIQMMGRRYIAGPLLFRQKPPTNPSSTGGGN